MQAAASRRDGVAGAPHAAGTSCAGFQQRGRTPVQGSSPPRSGRASDDAARHAVDTRRGGVKTCWHARRAAAAGRRRLRAPPAGRTGRHPAGVPHQVHVLQQHLCVEIAVLTPLAAFRLQILCLSAGDRRHDMQGSAKCAGGLGYRTHRLPCRISPDEFRQVSVCSTAVQAQRQRAGWAAGQRSRPQEALQLQELALPQAVSPPPPCSPPDLMHFLRPLRPISHGA